MIDRVIQQLPDVVTMVLAKWVERDLESGRFSLFATYNAVYGTSFPLEQRSMAVYLELTDGRGLTPLQLRLIDAGGQHEPIFVLDADINFASATKVYELIFLKMGGIVFPSPGDYLLQLCGPGRSVLRERRLTVTAIRNLDEDLCRAPIGYSPAGL